MKDDYKSEKKRSGKKSQNNLAPDFLNKQLPLRQLFFVNLYNKNDA